MVPGARKIINRLINQIIFQQVRSRPVWDIESNIEVLAQRNPVTNPRYIAPEQSETILTQRNFQAGKRSVPVSGRNQFVCDVVERVRRWRALVTFLRRDG